MSLLPVRSPFKTPEFLALFKKWNNRLERDGLEEIENFDLPDPALKAWHNLRFKKMPPERLQDIKKYYELAMQLLEDHEFKSMIHRQIWEMHAEGLSIRQIAIRIRKKKFTKTTIHRILINIKKTSGLKNG